MNDRVHMTEHAHRDYTGSKLGMWLFLVTELLLFGGLFLLYSVYRLWYPQDFHNAAKELNVVVGALNTVILITSSFTMALSIGGIQKGNKKLSTVCLALTVLLGMAFLANKYFEWSDKFHHGIYPNSPVLENLSKGENMFYGLYFVMTGLHGLHVLIGIAVLVVMFVLILRKPFDTYSINHSLLENAGTANLSVFDKTGAKIWETETATRLVRRIIMRVEHEPVKEKLRMEDFVSLENSGLYWHLVDIIWIFLFPLFYLIT